MIYTFMRFAKIVVIVLLTLVLHATDGEGERVMNQRIHSFTEIKPGTTTYNEVYEMCVPSLVTVTSYGLLCEYHTDGNVAWVKYSGQDMTVLDVVLSNPNEE